MTDSSETFPFADTPGSGALIKGRYRIEKEIGKGGMGVVYLASDTQLHNRPVVIKVLRDATAEDWLTKKFRQEIEALVRIEHPGVVGIFDAGEMPNKQMFVVMQFVEGVNLRSIMVQNKGALTLDHAGKVLDQIGRALTAAHDKGVLHCDLKPENIMLQTQQGEEIVKLIDFGIAKIRDSKVTSHEPTKIAGTMEYMAPEQISGAPTTASDVFSLGIIAYEMLTGQKPFPAQNLIQLFEMHKTGVKNPPKTLRPELSEAAQTVILKALSSDPEQRYKRARDFTDDLRKALDHPESVAPTELITKQQRVEIPKSEAPDKKKFALIANLLLLIIAGAIAWWAFRSKEEPRPLPPPPASTKTPVPDLPEIGLSYHVMLKKSEKGEPFPLAKEVLLEKDYRIQFFFKAIKRGHLYLINEGPGGYVILFPTSLTNQGSSVMNANQEIIIPGEGWFYFDKEEGTERIWVVFSEKGEISELEALKQLGNVEQQGSITDPKMVQNVSSFFKKHPPDHTESKRDMNATQTILKAKGDPLVHLIFLEHH